MSGLTAAYIISWFGSRDDPETRAKRIAQHAKQMRWMIDQGLNEIVVFAQDYDDLDYEFINESAVRYISNTGAVLKPGAARNVLLKEFYKSNHDMAIFADNDSVVYPYNCGAEFVASINRVWDQLTHVDAFAPLNSQMEPFWATYKAEPELYANNHVFHRSATVKGSFMTIKNFAKLYGVEIYYDPAFNNSKINPERFIPTEEIDFCLQIIAHGFGFYKQTNVVLQEYGIWTSTWIKTVADRKAEIAEANNIMVEKFKHLGLKLTKTGALSRRKFLNDVFKHPKTLTIKHK